MTTLTIDQAAAKYGIEKKRLIGFCLRNEFKDPLVVAKVGEEEYLVADDWRLTQLAGPQQPDKSNE